MNFWSFSIFYLPIQNFSSITAISLLLV